LILISIGPHGGVYADARPTFQERPFVRDNGSPTPTAGSASSTANDSKKKHGLTLGNPFRGKQTLEQTLLPPSTPTKAAKLLGVDPPIAHPGGLRGAPHVDGGSDEPARSRHRALKEAVARSYDNIDTSDDDEPPKAKGFWGHSKQAAMKLLGSPQPRSLSLAHIERPKWQDVETDYVNSVIDPIPLQPRRSRQNKNQRELERMTPITEVSHDNMSSANHDDGDSTELEVINEYTGRSQAEMAFPPRSQSLQPLPSLHVRSPLQAVEDRLLDVTEMNLEAEKKSKATQDGSPEEEDYSVHGTPVELSKAKGKQPVRDSPPPASENRTFTNIEHELQQIVIDMDKREAERLEMDKKVAALKVGHEKFKKDFYAAKALYDPEHASSSKEGSSNNEAGDKCHCCDTCECIGECDCVDADGFKPIRSSIDLDELLEGPEPTVHTAVAMPFLRVTPGMVKKIDIPPRKKKDTK
jgi:hypothetical protein